MLNRYKMIEERKTKIVSGEIKGMGRSQEKKSITPQPEKKKVSYHVCEQCGSVTSSGKGCECSRWA